MKMVVVVVVMMIRVVVVVVKFSLMIKQAMEYI